MRRLAIARQRAVEAGSIEAYRRNDAEIALVKSSSKSEIIMRLSASR